MVADLCVVIINWRDEERTLRCISAIRAWNDLKPLLLVVDNQSTRASREVLRSVLGSSELICSETNLGYAGGNNLGIAAALRGAASSILLLNSDATIAEQSIKRLINRLQANPKVGIIGPVLHECSQGTVQSYAGGNNIVQYPLTRQAVEPRSLSKLPGYPLIDADYVPGAVILVRGSLFEQVGLLDEQFFFSGEIADFCKRARERGYRVCVDVTVEARHGVGDASHSLRDTLYVYYSLRNRLLYAKKHCGARRQYFARWLGLCLAELGKAIAQGKARKARAISLAIAHGSTNRFGNQNAAFL